MTGRIDIVAYLIVGALLMMMAVGTALSAFMPALDRLLYLTFFSYHKTRKSSHTTNAATR